MLGSPSTLTAFDVNEVFGHLGQDHSGSKREWLMWQMVG